MMEWLQLIEWLQPFGMPQVGLQILVETRSQSPVPAVLPEMKGARHLTASHYGQLMQLRILA